MDGNYTQHQLLRRYKFQKKKCQESWPGRRDDYGAPFDFYEMLGEYESFDVSKIHYR